MHQENNSKLSLLKKYKLVSIVFIQDYLQLVFEGTRTNATISGYVWPLVKTESDTFSMGMAGYRDSLCELIGKRITNAINNDDDFLLMFSDGSEIRFSLRDEDQTGPEAINLHVGDIIMVW